MKNFFLQCVSTQIKVRFLLLLCTCLLCPIITFGQSGTQYGGTYYRPFTPVVDSQGNVYINGEISNQVKRISPDGTTDQVVYTGTTNLANGLAIDKLDNLYITQLDGRIIKRYSNGVTEEVFYLPGTYLVGLDIDKDGFIYSTDYYQ